MNESFQQQIQLFKKEVRKLSFCSRRKIFSQNWQTFQRRAAISNMYEQDSNANGN